MHLLPVRSDALEDILYLFIEIVSDVFKIEECNIQIWQFDRNAKTCYTLIKLIKFFGTMRTSFVEFRTYLKR